MENYVGFVEDTKKIEEDLVITVEVWVVIARTTLPHWGPSCLVGSFVCKLFLLLLFVFFIRHFHPVGDFFFEHEAKQNIFGSMSPSNESYSRSDGSEGRRRVRVNLYTSLFQSPERARYFFLFVAETESNPTGEAVRRFTNALSWCLPLCRLNRSELLVFFSWKRYRLFY